MVTNYQKHTHVIVRVSFQADIFLKDDCKAESWSDGETNTWLGVLTNLEEVLS